MFNLGITEIILMLFFVTLGLAFIVACLLGFFAFMKINRIEKILKDKKIL